MKPVESEPDEPIFHYQMPLSQMSHLKQSNDSYKISIPVSIEKTRKKMPNAGLKIHAKLTIQQEKTSESQQPLTLEDVGLINLVDGLVLGTFFY